ncbi:iron-containing redox enzyme family protein [Aspergillus tanneri]|uniref:Uncharacterized protein n=1 Tax=Aspergillus tanneri TaxID=1220188 RepID=A0A5M9MMM1_9EURO|nr:uncharacterized protein ATNIH1004_005339 [Aspergillus tanneri]KAA8646664.1 hypothetical protein ATNIH1004_005339 [Aspergillus tanneri]
MCNGYRVDRASLSSIESLSESLEYYKSLYFKLQNIEQHQDILSEARDLLLCLLSESVEFSEDSQKRGIFAIESFTEDNLYGFLQTSHQDVEKSCAQYFQERAAGWPRRLLADRKQAAEALAQLAPVKFVDGSWLGYIHQITTPFDLRPILKGAWQVLSEELGDGHVCQNHVQVYSELMQELGVDLPAPHTSDFINSKYGLKNVWVFKAAVVQLLISLFPSEFLPEILGFNLGFEGLTLETVILSKELQELKVGAQYFLLHISIDNAHSGHAKMSAHIVTQYLSYVERYQGKHAVQMAWRRIQAGYALSTLHSNHPEWPVSGPVGALSHLESKVLQILTAKAVVAWQLHGACPTKIGGLALSEWLNPERLASERRQREFLRELGMAKPWVIKGNAGKSKLIRELRWGGKMFGSFTQKEVEVLEIWINSLSARPKGQDSYWHFTRRDRTIIHCPGFMGIADSDTPVDEDIPLATISDGIFFTSPLDLNINGAWTRILPLWFSQTSLLESYIAVPSRAATQLGSAIVRILRAQYGFGHEKKGVSGMDEIVRQDSVDLINLGLEMLGRKHFKPIPNSLVDVLTRWPCPFAEKMIRLSKSPVRNIEILLGMSLAFVDLQRAVSASSELLSEAGKVILDGIVNREAAGLASCQKLIMKNDHNYRYFTSGYRMARTEIKRFLKN